MKKIILTVFLCLATIGNMQAKRTRIPMRVRTILYEQKKQGEIRHVPVSRSNIPLVEIDDNDIFISSIQVSYSVSLILYNNQGNIIYECMSNSSSSCLKIDIPSEIIEEAFSVQITSNGTDYIGEIY